mmetsp:Transcript_75380/g.179094  ORF Transcript_75380/g.179094 Transcript_75380/m.179094 type:complete len:254 (-) Transcript_75380:2246-3007(-)
MLLLCGEHSFRLGKVRTPHACLLCPVDGQPEHLYIHRVLESRCSQRRCCSKLLGIVERPGGVVARDCRWAGVLQALTARRCCGWRGWRCSSAGLRRRGEVLQDAEALLGGYELMYCFGAFAIALHLIHAAAQKVGIICSEGELQHCQAPLLLASFLVLLNSRPRKAPRQCHRQLPWDLAGGIISYHLCFLVAFLAELLQRLLTLCQQGAVNSSSTAHVDRERETVRTRRLAGELHAQVLKRINPALHGIVGLA